MISLLSNHRYYKEFKIVCMLPLNDEYIIYCLLQNLDIIQKHLPIPKIPQITDYIIDNVERKEKKVPCI